VVFGDVVDSRRGAARSTGFLRALRDELGAAYRPDERLADVGLTQGDELQVLLAPCADPFAAVLRAGLRPDALPMRWVIVAGDVDDGTGPATERTGAAFLAARELIGSAKRRRQTLAARTEDPDTDALLDDLGSLLPVLLADLTERQREAARLVLIDGLRRSDVAERLGVSRATVSVMADRAHVREIGGLARGLARAFTAGERRAAGPDADLDAPA
jgi:DNA-binding NarL/FixJ family response regulator